MSTSVLVAGLTFLFVFGAALGMRPSPRQAQLARLRAAATARGLRVRVAPATPGGQISPNLVVYVLSWRLEQLEQARELRFQAVLEPSGGWRAQAPPGLEQEQLIGILGDLPAGVTELTAVADGLAARWDERGAEHEVERLAAALVTLREACLGGGNRSSPAQGRT